MNVAISIVVEMWKICQQRGVISIIIKKSILEEAGIKYFIKNENRCSISSIIMNVDSGVAIELYT